MSRTVSLKRRAARWLGGPMETQAMEEAMTSRTRLPPPAYRHSAPSAPWPWVDLADDVETDNSKSPQPIPDKCDHQSCNGACWKEYPRSRFPNWLPAQVKRSRIQDAIENYDVKERSTMNVLDISDRGIFKAGDKIIVPEEEKDKFWNTLIDTKSNLQRPAGTRVRAIFVENMSGPVLQMLGAKFNIEPFFFSSSLSWIPSRFQEEVRPGIGDHITVTFVFLRPVACNQFIHEGLDDFKRRTTFNSARTTNLSFTWGESEADFYGLGPQIINTQRPLELHTPSTPNGHALVHDLLSVHLLRNVDGNTIISYHDELNEATTAEYLHQRMHYAGQSVYWQSILQRCADPTFILLLFVWHTVYAWDESLEVLYKHICTLETQVIITANIKLTRELHLIQAHLLHYASLLDDIRKSVVFILQTPNPAMEGVASDGKELSEALLEKECNTLLQEVERLEASRMMMEKRLKNVMNLVFSSVNIEDSRRMQQLTQAAVRDSAAMKQIAYLTMVFLPASFVAAVFGMNVKEVSHDTDGTLGYYFAAAMPLTFVTIWIIMAFQSKYLFKSQRTTFWSRLWWPWEMIKDWVVDEDGVTRNPRSRSETFDLPEYNGPRTSLSTLSQHPTK
ncbi:hypothetical protein CYLTODRAFT_420913 [Cylindrobasidium torrendii FP15055 ss-10]|uniref:Cora-domain-containing protein n=1 Tax=Cylindrobasidium torrendii FP15055 ss-10 TaxID=1314674 RepID=A0A0D7BFB0_9AGAR|nr:hypothetical protein CYLTODRAFT_420913 [Cylindrobasidium torrendii FP15055 ss-10]